MHKSFIILAVAQFFVQLAHALFEVSLIWLALDMTGSRFSTGVLMFTAYLPFFLFSIPAGLFADSKDRRQIIRWSVTSRILIALLIPLFACGNMLSFLVLAGSAFFFTSLEAFFLPARDALIPEYVSGANLLRGNSIIQGSMQLAFIIGPAIAGFLIDWLGNLQTFLMVSALFVAASILVWQLKPGQRDPENPLITIDKKAVAELFTHIKTDKRLAWLIGITMIDNLFIMGPAIIGVAIFVKEDLGGPAVHYALSESFLAGGMILTSLLLILFGKKLPMGKLLIIGIFMDGLTYVPVRWIEQIEMLWVTIFLHALFIPFITVSRTTIVQKIVPRQLQGRVFAIISLSVVGFTAFSMALTGWIAELIPVRDIFFYIGIGGAISGLIATLYGPLRILK
ncbi:MAG TPA: MFS transporter [Candidatus Marinimicrobia bacterium]|nr:MFS transporter [Candidatus Neomarinimicrobiota bacterium]